MAHILIIDDSPTERHVFKTMLEKNNHQVSVATGGEQGLEMARDLKPDVILMDVVMPGMDGFKATRELSKDAGTANIPVIMVTTKDQETDKVWGMRQGARDYIVKPAKEKMLIERINAALGQ